MNSNISEEINNVISSKELSMKTNNISIEKSNKPPSDSSGNKMLSKSNNICPLNSIETYKTIVSISAFKDLLQTILKIIIPQEKLKKYGNFDYFLEENVKNEIIKDIEDVANEIKNLKDKEEKEINRKKDMESIRLDIDSKYINLNKTIKEMNEMMKQYQDRNNELLSQVLKSQEIIINLKAEINSLSLYIKEKINNSIKNTSDITFEDGFFKTRSQPIKTQANNYEFPPLNNANSSRNIIKSPNQINYSSKKNIAQITDKISNINNYKYKYKVKKKLMKGPKSNSKSKNRSKILNNNNSKEKINSIYIINLKNKNNQK